MSEQPLDSRSEGLRLLQAGDFEGAAKQLQKAAAENPSDAQAFALLGVCHAKRGDSTSAITSLAEAARLQPADPAPRYNLAVALYQAHRLPEARVAVEQALALNPSHAKAQELLTHLGDVAPAGMASGMPGSQGWITPPAGSPLTGAVSPSGGVSPGMASPSGEPVPPFGNPGPTPLGADPGAPPPPWGAPQPGQGASPAFPPSAAFPTAPVFSPTGSGPGSAAPTSGATIVQGPQGMAFSPQQAKLANQQPPSMGRRVGRGLLWGAVWGQWWTVLTIVSQLFFHPASIGAGLMVYGVICLFGYAFFGAIAGLIIALINADLGVGAGIAIGTGMVCCLLEYLVTQSSSAFINVIFYFITGRYIGANIAARVRQPVLSQPQ